jgi:hypothetical protein
MIQQVKFKGCCAARIVYGFGGDVTCDINRDVDLTVEDHIEQLKTMINHLRNEWIFGQKQDPTIVVITNHMQKNANKALLKLGFEHGRWLKKKQHPNRKIRVWHLAPETVV